MSSYLTQLTIPRRLPVSRNNWYRKISYVAYLLVRLSVNIPMLVQILQRHKIHLAQHQQAVTCQICLDLLHRPFALAPCGHITCYNCLIRWFTALQNPNPPADDIVNPLPENVDEVQLIVSSAEAERGTYLRRRKTCPVCRAAVLLRPVEMWGIKSMVVTLVNSKLVDLPVPVPPPNSTTPGGPNNNVDANNDPWLNIFHPTNTSARQGPLVQIQADMGMYDNEDGGIYRCIDCFHEIWGGVCSGCNRGYPGHEGDDDVELDFYQYGLEHQTPPDLVDDNDVESIPFWEQTGNFVYPMLGSLFMRGDEGMTDSEDDDIFFDPFQPAFLGSPALEGMASVDEGSDEEHESDYGGSFIDDNEEGRGENMDDGPEVIEFNDALSDNDASSDEEHSRPYPPPRARIQQRRWPMFTSEDEGSIIDTDDDDDEANHIPAILARYSDGRTRNPTRRHAAVMLTDDSRSSGEEHDDDEEELAAEDVLSRSRARLRWDSSDEE